MDFELRGRTALVTGASQGIGKALARMLAMQGVRVVGAARRTPLIEAWRKRLSQLAAKRSRQSRSTCTRLMHPKNLRRMHSADSDRSTS